MRLHELINESDVSKHLKKDMSVLNLILHWVPANYQVVSAKVLDHIMVKKVQTFMVNGKNLLGNM
jgi:hypothetical protein